jgi:hypothetical protein
MVGEDVLLLQAFAYPNIPATRSLLWENRTAVLCSRNRPPRVEEATRPRRTHRARISLDLELVRGSVKRTDHSPEIYIISHGSDLTRFSHYYFSMKQAMDSTRRTIQVVP